MTHTPEHDDGRARTTPVAGKTAPGEYGPAGEQQRLDATFAPDQVAEAFAVESARVLAAFQGEFGYGSDGRVTSKEAQQLAEVLLGDQPLDIREAALMRLGAFVPRSDHETGLGEKAPGEESDRLDPDAT